MTREEIESKIKEILVADFELDGQKLVPEALFLKAQIAPLPQSLS